MCAYKRQSPQPVLEGGTGNSTLTVHGVLIGESANPINSTVPGTTGQVLIGSTGVDPAFGALGVNSSLTANGVLLGNNLSAITATAAGTTGQVLTGVTSGAPTFQAPAASSISITGNTGTITGNAFTITTGAANTQGTALFTGSGTTLTHTFTTATGNNTGIGLSALDSLAGGINNTAFGSGALNLNTTGGDNTAFGYQALQANVSGSNNTAVGYEALTASVGSGGNSANTAVGMNSMKAMTSGANNTAIGYGSLTGATTAAENAAFGFNVFPSLASGTYNMGMGINSGTGYTGAESNNIIINAPGTAGESNVLRIGTATGTGTQDLNAAYICGIQGTNISSSTATVVTIAGTNANQLGSATITAGTGLTVAPTANTITVGLTSPVTVANGGSGDTSHTAYAVLCGGTTSTGAVQSIASVGTSGQVLTSNGAAALPTFQAASGGSGITTIDGNSGSVTGATVTITTGASKVQGTSKFTGSGTTLTQTFTTTDGLNNTGIGLGSLDSASLSGDQNTCFGSDSGSGITTGSNNTFIGYSSGPGMSTGSGNCCLGSGTLLNAFATGSYNICAGYISGTSYSGSESSNILLNNNGTAAESNVLRIGAATGTGTQDLNAAYICGITGITGTGAAVLISTANQLCVAVSSREFKENIENMTDESELIYKLQPVTFTWKKDSAPGLKDATDAIQYGLIAEEAVEVMPSIVNLKDGKPFNINYNDLIPLLLNEIQKQHADIIHLYERIQALEEDNGI